MVATCLLHANSQQALRLERPLAPVSPLGTLWVDRNLAGGARTAGNDKQR